MLEDCGYMARAAFLMDKLMARVGLSGKSFIPLLSSFACADPGHHGDARDREPPRPAGDDPGRAADELRARLPVYVLLIGAFVPRPRSGRGVACLGCRALTMLAMYLIGIVAGDRAVAWLLEADAAPRRDAAVRDGAAALQVAGAARCAAPDARPGWAFVRRAGTLILAVSVVVWAACLLSAQSGPRRGTSA